jgi:asparagine N-glycosylation enzyme membrane subunit Stt3
MKEQNHNRKYQLCIIGLLGVVVGLALGKNNTPQTQPDDTYVSAQYQSPNDSIFQSVGNKAEISGDQLAMFQSIFDLIKQYTAVVNDPTACSVAAIMSIEDNMTSKEEAIRLLEMTLQTTRSPQTQRAIRMKLMELYNKTGQSNKTQDMLRSLIVQ